MSLPPSASKPQWRQWAQGVRSELPVAELSAELVGQLRAWQPYRDASHVLSYMTFGDELDLSALTEDDGKTFYVTRTWKKPELRLSVHRLDGGLERHPYGYYQPPAGAEPVDPKTLDLVLVPGLCFDQAGRTNRLWRRLLRQVLVEPTPWGAVRRCNRRGAGRAPLS